MDRCGSSSEDPPEKPLTLLDPPQQPQMLSDPPEQLLMLDGEQWPDEEYWEECSRLIEWPAMLGQDAEAAAAVIRIAGFHPELLSEV